MSTSRQDQLFAEAIGSQEFLDRAIDWIKTNLNPEEVFKERDLDWWAESNGYVKGL